MTPGVTRQVLLTGRPTSVRTRVLECPRGGWIWLTTKWGISITVPTVCQTWRCPRCGQKRKAYASMRAEHGCLFLAWRGPLRLITVTYRMTGPQDIQNAQSALSDFRRLVQLLRRRSKSQFRWFRVPEVTRKGQIHWHVISGDLIGSRLSLERLVRDCWALASRRKGVVHNYVVDVSPTNAANAAGYVSKYLLKSAMGFEALTQRGFTRRWACSRDWTKPEPIQLRGTVEDAWLRKEWFSPLVGEKETRVGRREASFSKLADRVGDPLVLTLQERNRKRSVAKQMAKILGGHNATLPARNL